MAYDVNAPGQPGRRLVNGGNERMVVLKETLDAFADAAPEHYQTLAAENLSRWFAEAKPTEGFTLLVLPEDWGVATLALTKQYGKCFAVLNMANAYSPGGGYVEGHPAQEENMFRRTDCHFSVTSEEYDAENDCYWPVYTAMISGMCGFVYLDTEKPRVCIRGPEAPRTMWYPWLPDDEVFPFFEMRSAAEDLRDGARFDETETRARIEAQLNTLKMEGIRHVVLGAFGCGAFGNPTREVAQIYKECIQSCEDDFDVIAFAIYHAGYGPDNYAIFKRVFEAR